MYDLWMILLVALGAGCSHEAQPPEVLEVEGATLVVSEDGRLTIEESGEVVFPHAAAFSSEGTKLAILYSHASPMQIVRSQSIRLVDLSTSPPLQSTFQLGLIDRSAYDVTGMGNTGVPYFSGEDDDLLAIIPRWSPEHPELSVVDVFSGETRFRLERDSASPVSAWTFSSDGSLLAVCGQHLEPDPDGLFRYVGGILHVWELRSETLRFSHSFDEGTYGTIAFSPDSTILAVGGGVSTRNTKSGKVQLYDAVTGELLNTDDEYVFPVPAVLFAPDGSCVISSDLGGTIRFWSDFQEGTGETESIVLRQSPWRVSKLAISPDGRLLAVALSNFNRGQKQGEIRLIDVTRRVQVGTLMADHALPIDYVAFSAGGTILAAQCNEDLRVWHLSESLGD